MSRYSQEFGRRVQAASGQTTQTRYRSPLRYPGGKARLAHYFKALFRANDLLDAEYVEPYAGGASVGLELLFSDHASRIHINDLSRPVYAFWHSVLHDTEELSRRVHDARLTLSEYQRQRAALSDPSADLPSLCFAAFYLNRTSRSGIISPKAGAIGGVAQAGAWTLDARFNRTALVDRIERIADLRSRIRLYNLDAEVLLRTFVSKLPRRSLVYLDPPYFLKGQRLYANFYESDDHAVLAARVTRLQQRWVISYDDVQPIRRLYSTFPSRRYSVPYSAAEVRSGAEVMFYSRELKPPRIADPARFTHGEFVRWLRTTRANRHRAGTSRKPPKIP